jgi:hypothetical protein
MVSLERPVAAMSADTSIQARASILPASSSSPSRVRSAVRERSPRPRAPHHVVAHLLGEAAKAGQLGPVMDRKRPSGPSTTTL